MMDFCSQFRLCVRVLFGIVRVDSDVIDGINLGLHWLDGIEKWERNGRRNLLFIDFKKPYGTVIEVDLLEIGIIIRLARRIRVCLDETYLKSI
jgi:hypothetical protein